MTRPRRRAFVSFKRINGVVEVQITPAPDAPATPVIDPPRAVSPG